MASGAFNLAVSQYAQLTADSRVKVWEVASGRALQEFTPPWKLAAELTAVSWCLPSSSSTVKPKKHQKAASVLGVGTAQGHVILWECARGEMKRALGGPEEGRSSRVHDVVFGAGGATVYACTEDSQVTCWNTTTGEVVWSASAGKQPCKRMAMHPDEDAVATAGTSIKIWDIASQRIKRKYVGHASSVTSLLFSPDAKYLISAAGDRYISLWDASEAGTEKNAIMVFTTDSAPTCLSFSPDSSEGLLSFLAVAQSGSVGVWRIPAPGGKKQAKEGSAPVPAQCRVSCEGKADKVIRAAFDSDGRDVCVCHGSDALPLFEKFGIEDEDGNLKETVMLSKQNGGLLQGKKAAKKKSLGDDARMEDIVGEGDMPTNGAGMDVVRADAVGGKKRRVQEDEREHEELSDDDIGSLDAEETLEDKLRALGLDGGKEAEGTVGSIKADSVHALLLQALQCDDKALLEQCLGVMNQRVINATVAKLPPAAVSLLLTKVVGKFQAKPTRSLSLVTWIRAVLTQHTSYLMSQPDVVKSLTPLFQFVESRVSTYHKLLKLEGRLELALSQVSNKEPASGSSWKEPDLTVHYKVDEVIGEEEGADSSDESGEEEEEMEEDDDDDDSNLDWLMEDDDDDDNGDE